MLETIFMWIGIGVVTLAAIPTLVICLTWVYFKAWDQVVRILDLNTILYNVAIKLKNERQANKKSNKVQVLEKETTTGSVLDVSPTRKEWLKKHGNTEQYKA